MRRLLRRFRDTRLTGGTDDGLTLTETVVSMGIVGLVLVAASVMMTSSLRGNALASGKTTSQADARLAVEYLTRDLRTAATDPITTDPQVAVARAAPDSITFYTVKEGSSATFYKIQYAVDATSKCLKRTATKYTSGAFPASAARSACVVPGIVDAPSSLFQYYPSRSSFATDPAALSIPSTGTTDATLLGSIVGVRITLSLRAADRRNIAPTTATQDVTLINSAK